MYNTSEHSTTKRTLFFANKGLKANILLKTQKYEELVPHIILQINNIYKLQNELRLDLMFFNRVKKKFINRKRVRGPTLKKRNKV